jgi:hypothetical protein
MKNNKTYSDEDIKIYKQNISRLHNLYDKLYELVNFPPFRLSQNGDMSSAYINELREIYSAEINAPVDDFLDAEYKPLREFSKKFKENISEAQKYYDKSNGKYLVALDLYIAANPEIKIGDDEIYLPYLTAW